MKGADGLQEEERVHLNTLFVESPKLQEVYLRMRAFRVLLSQRAPEQLDDWSAQMENCCAFGLRQDCEAENAAWLYDWSNGKVGGRGNRQKIIKHRMQGRAGFDLLCQRVLGSTL